MKRVVINFLGLAAIWIFAAQVDVSAQTGAVSGTRFGIGQDSIACTRALSLYQQDYQHRNFDDALVNWRRLWRDCPISSPNLTPQGALMYKHYIDRELNAARKDALIDTLMQVWERGIELRPQVRETYQTQMMQDMLRYLDTPENQHRLLEKLEDLMNTQKERTTAFIYANYMRIIFAQHREGKLSDEDLLDNYNRINDVIS